jgi:hypothetical protein
MLNKKVVDACNAHACKREIFVPSEQHMYRLSMVENHILKRRSMRFAVSFMVVRGV